MSRAYLCVTIDCECDKGPRWRSRSPLAFAGVRVGIGERLQPLFASYGARPTYLLSSEVIADAASAELLAGIGAAAELGAHLHGEYAEPGAHEPEVTRDFQRDYPGPLEREKLVSLTSSFAETFGRCPASFRAGRFGIGPNTLPILEELGYTVDTSVTPGLDWACKGARGLRFSAELTQPYHPDPGQPARRGSSPLLEVPVTIRPRALARVPLVGRLVEPRWLRPTHGSAAALVALAREEIAAAAGAGRPVVLNAMFHNVEVIAGASPYAATEAQARGVLERLRGLLEFARSEGIPTIGVGEVPGVLEP